MKLEEVVDVPWSDFKAFLARTLVSYSWIELVGSNYQIRAQQGSLIAACMIEITTPANADQLDFEANYKH